MDAEKIICCDRGCGNGWEAAAMMNGMNGFGNGNGMWLLLLLLLGGRGWNGWGNGNNGVNTEFSLLQDQAQQNQNTNLLREAMRDNFSAVQQLAQNLNCDFNTMQQCCCDLKQAVATVGGQVGLSAEKVINAVNMGDCNVIQAIKDCCCTTQKAILEQGYQNQLANCQQTNTIMQGINGVNVGVERGFSNVGFETQKQTCDIIKAITDSQQKTADLLNNKWQNDQAREIQDLKNEISQLKQTEAITAAVFARLNGNGCGCACGNGVGY